jgi:hypothetical protein
MEGRIVTKVSMFLIEEKEKDEKKKKYIDDKGIEIYDKMTN